MRRSAALAVALVLVGAPAAAPLASAARKTGAAVDRAHIPGGGPPPTLTLPKPARFALSSGAQVLVVERHTLPMAVVAVVWPTGGANEPLDRAGLAGLTADLLDEGTKQHGALQLAQELESLGANIESGSGWDSTVVSLTSLTKNLDRSLALLAEVVSSPAFDGKELERKRAERLTALLQQKDSASAVAGDVFSSVLYGPKDRFGTPLIGTEAGLKSITRDDVVGYFHSRLQPSRATVIVAGDVTVDGARATLEKALADWKAAGPAEPAKVVGGLSPATAPVRALVDKPGAPQSEVRIGEPGVPRGSPDYFPLLVMNAVLGGQFSSRLNLNLREAHGYTYGARSDFAFRKRGGPFAVATAAKTAVTGPALDESFKELGRIRDDKVSDKELRLARDLLERAMARRFETLSDVASELSTQVVFELPDDYFATFAGKVEAVTADDVLRVARAHLDPRRMAVVVVGDRAAVAPQLGKLHLGAFEQLDVNGKPVAPVAPPH